MCVPDHLTQKQLCLTSRCGLCLRVDYASEMSGLAKNPILVQSSTAMLAQA
ncbi:TPA: flagellin FliC, partial [Candidatus Poribacteria bacterium]|nr:flagellin FliC [Candidatus Poribacteria bacterium]